MPLENIGHQTSEGQLTTAHSQINFMKLFGQIIRTVVNVAQLPVEVVKDVVTLGNYGEGSYTKEQLEKIKEEATED